MCGIAGIIYLSPVYADRLGSDLIALIQPLETRGPDSCGVALYGNSQANRVKLLLRGTTDSWQDVQQWVSQFAPVVAARSIADGCQFTLDISDGLNLRTLKQQFVAQFPHLQWVSVGQALEIYKEVGAVRNLSDRYGLQQFSGTHAIGHTRMATESAVDTDRCHPFTSSCDLAIVHNGQIANYYKLRFQLERAGAVFATDNDSEAIAHYIDYQLLQGKTLEAALYKLLEDIDGTYTFLVSTPHQVGLVRDKFAAKPAVVYESPELVAIASEYRALLNLPNFNPAYIREPDAGEVNVWSVANVPQISVGAMSSL